MAVKLSDILRLLSVAILIVQAGVAGALCLDANMVSGYHQPLKEELADSVSVIIGDVVKETTLSEDSSDPEDVTATLYRVRVLAVIRGKATKEIVVRDENDSGRFGFDLGKRYLLFVRHSGAGENSGIRTGPIYYVSQCGSSGLLSESTTILKQLGVAERVYK